MVVLLSVASRTSSVPCPSKRNHLRRGQFAESVSQHSITVLCRVLVPERDTQYLGCCSWDPHLGAPPEQGAAADNMRTFAPIGERSSNRKMAVHIGTRLDVTTTRLIRQEISC